MLRRRLPLVAAALLALSLSPAAAAPQLTAGSGLHSEAVASAHAVISGSGVTGSAQFVEWKDGTVRWVEYTIEAAGLKPGLHGVHLHAVGRCTPGFAAAGGHFDPGPHGDTDPDANHPYHLGDLSNLVVDESGRGTLHGFTTRVTLSGSPVTVFDADGTAVIVHANEDRGITGPPGSGISGGPRVACGVIEKN